MSDTEWTDAFHRQHVGVKLAVAVGVLMAVGLLILGGIFSLGTFFFYDSYSSSYYYEGSIYIEGETENAVFVLPVGVHDGEAVVNDLYFAETDRFNGIEHEVIDTQHGPMVRIEVAEVSEGSTPLWFDSVVESEESIGTRQPQSVEPVLSPTELTEPDFNDERVPYDRGPYYRSFDATGQVYVEHGGSEDVEVGFMVSYEGANEWWSFGWNGNRYETALIENREVRDTDGTWIEIRGWHAEGVGSYPRFPPPPS